MERRYRHGASGVLYFGYGTVFRGRRVARKGPSERNIALAGVHLKDRWVAPGGEIEPYV